MREEKKLKNCLYRKIGTTLYEIIVRQSDNAKETAEDILARLIATDQKESEDSTDG